MGHYQRGGSPSAFDRNLGTLLGHAAVHQLQEAKPEDPPQLIGMRGNRVESSHLMECVDLTRQIAAYADENKYEKVLELRGPGFQSTYQDPSDNAPVRTQTQERRWKKPQDCGYALRWTCAGNEHHRPGSSTLGS